MKKSDQKLKWVKVFCPLELLERQHRSHARHHLDWTAARLTKQTSLVRLLTFSLLNYHEYIVLSFFKYT